ncbi:MAG: lasso peptide biosynthesis B2 protein [Candidatus Omnitrophica bacterium]|nr:lasso peptide biosynthesis B2 protein [Candidatus Omnitrophota bacterium]
MDCWNPWHRLIRELWAGALKKFLRLSALDRRDYVQVSVLLLLAELALRLWSLKSILQVVQQRCARAQRGPRRAPDPGECDRLAWLVALADRHGFLRPSCLRQASVAAWLFSGRGIAPSLLIGVAKEDGRLQAHAWVESNGQTDAALVVLE